VAALIAAFETAAEVGGVALIEGDAVIAERVLGHDAQPARDLLPALRDLLERIGRPLDDVRDIALSVGPGSFTGLRIGLATALGLCFGEARRIIPVPTLAAMAYGVAAACGDAAIVPILDARKRQVYGGVYVAGDAAESPVVALRPDAALAPEAFVASFDGLERTVLLGPGVPLCLAAAKARLGGRASVLDGDGWPTAGAVGSLGARLLRIAPPPPVEKVELCYLRASHAELEPHRPGKRRPTPQ
jgi:tRNA threonylcarbamoyladenosine biosynthesis protein TsaB